MIILILLLKNVEKNIKFLENEYNSLKSKHENMLGFFILY